jgi:hypothetical protein
LGEKKEKGKKEQRAVRTGERLVRVGDGGSRSHACGEMERSQGRKVTGKGEVNIAVKEALEQFQLLRGWKIIQVKRERNRVASELV